EVGLPRQGGGGKKGGPPRELETLLVLLGTSQFLADLLATQPELLDGVRKAGAAPPPARLAQELQAEVDAADADSAVLRAFRPPPGPPAAPAAGPCSASAPPTSCATGRWKKSPATCRPSPTPPSASPCGSPCARWPSAGASRARPPAGPPASPSSPSASSAAR